VWASHLVKLRHHPTNEFLDNGALDRTEDHSVNPTARRQGV
jgi:hypothetical protein